MLADRPFLPPTRSHLSACAPCLAARGRAPNDGGLNVEGAAWLGDRLWLGLRGPLVGGKALLLETTWSPDSIAVTRVVEADLGGGAVRELVAWKGGLVAVTGSVGDSDAGHALWWLSAPGAPPKRLALDLPPSSEGLAIGEDGSGIVVMDGDGKPGKPCGTPARWQRVKVPAP